MGKKQPVEIDGVWYPSVQAAADHLGVSVKTVWNKRNTGNGGGNEREIPVDWLQAEEAAYRPNVPTEEEIAEAVQHFRKGASSEQLAHGWAVYGQRRPDSDYEPRHYLHPVSVFQVFAGRLIFVLVIVLFLWLVWRVLQ